MADQSVLRLDAQMMPSNFGNSMRLYMIESNQLLLDTGYQARNANTTAGQAIENVQQAIDDSGTALTGVTTLNQAVDALDSALVAVATDYVSLTKKADQSIASGLQAANFRVGGNQVVGSRVSGFTPSAGGSKVGLDAGVSYAVGASYAQAELQAVASGLQEVRKMVASIQAALTQHGLIG